MFCIHMKYHLFCSLVIYIYWHILSKRRSSNTYFAIHIYCTKKLPGELIVSYHYAVLVQYANWLVQSWARGSFQQLITSERLKGRDGNGKKTGIWRKTQKYRESSVTKETSKIPFTLRQTHRFLDERRGYYGNRYSTHHNGIWKFYVLVITLSPTTSKINATVSCRPFFCV